MSDMRDLCGLLSCMICVTSDLFCSAFIDLFCSFQMKAEIDVAMGGRVAEELIFGHENVTSGASSDFEHATKIAFDMVEKFGMSDASGYVAFGNNSTQAGGGGSAISDSR